MKTTQKFFRTAIILLISALVLTACKTDDGRDGIDGQDGAPGTQGPAGPQGPTGQDGNANVVSRTFSASQITWSNTLEYGSNYKTANLNMPEITQNIIDNGVVMVYAALNFSGTNWTALPLSYYESGSTRYFSYGIAVGNVKLKYSNSNNTIPSTPGISFRVIVIEGKAAGKARSNGVNLNDYEQTKAYFKLKE